MRDVTEETRKSPKKFGEKSDEYSGNYFNHFQFYEFDSVQDIITHAYFRGIHDGILIGICDFSCFFKRENHRPRIYDFTHEVEIHYDSRQVKELRGKNFLELEGFMCKSEGSLIQHKTLEIIMIYPHESGDVQINAPPNLDTSLFPLLLSS